MANPVVVLGMHRSFTSLLAAWLHVNGVIMYDTRTPPPHHEDQEILDLHERLLKTHGMNALNARAPFVDSQNTFHEQAKEILIRRNKEYPLWGWKDPRCTVLYEFLWQDLVPAARLLLIFRNPDEVAESLYIRKVKKRTRYLFLPDAIYSALLSRNRTQYDETHLVCWNYYNRRLLQLTHSIHPDNFILINGNTLIENEHRVRDLIQTKWGISLGDRPFADLIESSSIKSVRNLTTLRPGIVDETTGILNALNTIKSI